ncbi:DUF4145 domain-containing protein [Falsiroseomonas ponticola]|uniref:DUF4145 domain-containing protein n=1 Tax=Falsiroseomonas ponticola TaxID=2786951 RepID=UPI001933C5D4|nr:DUF4145 domain-containing protein [Roseomonas ponticola]
MAASRKVPNVFKESLELFAAHGSDIEEFYPRIEDLDQSIPEAARVYLAQAFLSLHAPDGAVMLAASSIDAMLKALNLQAGSLYSRIEAAVKGGKLTPAMAQWAHQVRLDANDVRHADEKSPHHDEASARRVLEFARALADFLFVFPHRVNRGLTASATK